MSTWRTHALLPLLVVVVIALAAGLILWRLGRADPPGTGIAQTVQAGELRVTAQIDALAVGPRVIDVLVHDAAGKPVDLRGVRLRFVMAEMDMGQIETDAQPVGTGHFRTQGQFFTMAGRWQVDATLLRADQTSINAPFVFAIAAPGEASGPLNPLAPDAPTLAVGRQLYQANCVVCHGASGHGDGPAALALSPRPSDFTQHMLPGKHTDGQVFMWIKDGYPNTAMPAWGQRFSETQLWQLVTFLRTFGQPVANAPTAQPGPQPTAQPLSQPTSAPAQPEPLPPMVFVRQGNLWRSDGSGVPSKQLTTLESGSYAEYPTMSPDGTRIAFVATTQAPITETTQLPLPTPQTRLYLMRADGSDLRSLWEPERGTIRLTTWTPDGQALYVGFADLRSVPDAPVPDRLFQIVRVDVTTGARQLILNDAFDPTLARDGALLAYLHYDKTYATFRLYVAARDGSGDRELLGVGAFSDLATPRFSPDAKQIIFAAHAGPVTDPQGYPIKTGARSPLQQLLALLEPPTAEAHGALWDLWVINTDGSGLRRLPNVREDTPMAVFSADGRQLVMMGAGGIYLLNPDGSNLRKIDPLGDHGGLDWARP
jgi:mono/diheme cytochrome c family protein